MKKFILLLMASMAIFGASAQNGETEQTEQDGVKNAITEYLKNEGYVPKLDKDGDIGFKAEGTQYYIRVYDGDNDGYRYLELYALYTYENTAAVIAPVANDTQRRFKQVRITYEEDKETKGKFHIWFETPCFTTDGSEFNKLLKQYLSCINDTSNYFFAQLNGDESE